ncbi:MAG: hypothetical protein LBQ74_00415 [Prevotella sp.]|nr:hypothetical protein [Prevotella sp.]
MEKITKLLFFCLFLWSGVQAQQVGNIKSENIRFEYDRDRIYIVIDFPLRDYYVDNNTFFSLTPFIKSDTKTINLPKVILENGNVQAVEDADTYIIQSYDNRYNLHYNVSIPYEPWMNEAQLGITNELDEFGRISKLYTYTGILKSNMKNGRITESHPSVFVESASRITSLVSSDLNTTEIDKRLYYTRIIEVFFPDMKSSDVSVIPANLPKIHDLCDFVNEVVNSQNYSLVGIYLTGYTSPEGIYYDNVQIAKNRVQSIQFYIEDRCYNSLSYFHPSWIGENWPGLINLINKDYNVPNSDQILDIIENIDVFKGREKQLMLLNGGIPYRYMKAHLFPKLQSVECKIVYKEKRNE